MEKRLLVVQEHLAKRAGLHWDLRFEDHGGLGSLVDYTSKRDAGTSEPTGLAHENRVLRSFVLPKHRMPGPGKVRLAIRTEDHPWEYKDFEGTIESGYGAGEVGLVFSGEVDVSEFTDDKITFEFKDHWYTLFRAGENYLVRLDD